jgi:hypothetical protein
MGGGVRLWVLWRFRVRLWVRVRFFSLPLSLKGDKGEELDEGGWLSTTPLIPPLTLNIKGLDRICFSKMSESRWERIIYILQDKLSLNENTDNFLSLGS